MDDKISFMKGAWAYWDRRLAFPMGLDHWMLTNPDEHDRVFQVAADIWDGQNYLNGAKQALIESVRRVMGGVA
jgi:hypothetical protein